MQLDGWAFFGIALLAVEDEMRTFARSRAGAKRVFMTVPNRANNAMRRVMHKIAKQNRDAA